MKVGIITIFDLNPNYGNRLQNYAVNSILEKLGMKTETIYVEQQKNSLKEKIKCNMHKITMYKFCKEKNYWKYEFKKIVKFGTFNDKYIPNKQIKSFKRLDEQYDYFVVGSDQVWNPIWYDERKKEAFLLTFAKNNQKVCFSPSFGLSEIPEHWREHFKKALGGFNCISVREDAGAEIVKRLTGKKAEVLIDPTLMLTRNDWIKIEKKPDNVNFNKKYILTYFLGGKNRNQQIYINNIAKQNNLEVYNLLDYTQPDIYISDPAEFIYLIHNAEIIFTDSFHACVFSFIFQRPFQVFERNGSEKNMISRIETLLKKFDLERKFYGNNQNELFECDYSEGYRRLNGEQDKVIKFLRKSLNIE